MDCHDFEGLVYALAEPENQAGGTGDGFLDDAIWQAAVTHAESCLACARLLTDARSLHASLAALATADQGRQAPALLESLLVSEFEREHGVRAMGPRPSSLPASLTSLLWSWIGSNWAMAAIAASALVVFLLVGRRAPSGTQTRPTSPAAVSQAEKVSEAAARAPSPQRLAGQARRKRPSPRRTAPVRQTPAETEYATGFLPLEYDGDPSDLSRADLVRVELPRSTLVYFGLASGDDASGTVTAELLIGQDGTPEAVRLLARN